MWTRPLPTGLLARRRAALVPGRKAAQTGLVEVGKEGMVHPMKLAENEERALKEYDLRHAQGFWGRWTKKSALGYPGRIRTGGASPPGK